MTDPSIDRRRFLGALCALAGAGGAGCLGRDRDDSPASTDWVPAETPNFSFASLTLELTEQTEDRIPQPIQIIPQPSTTDEKRVQYADPRLENPDDPLLELPMRASGATALGGAVALGIIGLGYLIGSDTSVAELLRVDDKIIALGDIDRQRAATNLRDGGSDPTRGPAYEQTGEHGAFRLFEPVESVDGDAPTAVAVSERAVLVTGRRADVITIIDTANGEHSRAVEEYDRFEWLTDAVGDGDILVGWHGSVDPPGRQFGENSGESVYDIFPGDDDVLSAVTFAPDEQTATVDLALQTDSPQERSAKLETALETTADELSLTPEDDTITVSKTYEGINFEQVEPEPEEDEPEEGEVPPEVARAVPDNAFSFEYNEAKRYVRVRIRKEFDVAKIKAESVEREFEVSTDKAYSGSWLNVYVDETDTVRVIVTVDGASGVVETFEIPPS